jgi:autotransporter-associated beta strand protein
MQSLSAKMHWKYIKIFSVGMLNIGMMTIPNLAIAEEGVESNTLANAVWNGATDGYWTTTTNWTPNGIPSAVTAQFPTGASNTTIAIAGTQPAITGMIFDSSAPSYIFNFTSGSLTLTSAGIVNSSSVTQTFNIDSGSSFTLGGGSLSNGVTVNNNGGSLLFTGTATPGTATINNTGGIMDISGLTTGTTFTLQSPYTDTSSSSIVLGGNTLTVGTTITIAGLISGTGGVTMSGSGQTLTFTNANTYTGVTTISNSGVLTLSGTGAISTGDVIVNNGTFNVFNSGAGSATTITVNSGGTVNYGNSSVHQSTPAATGGSTINVASGGAVNFTDNACGTTDTCTGTITNNGTLMFSDGPGSTTGTDLLTIINNGTLSLGTISHAFTIGDLSGTSGITLGTGGVNLTLNSLLTAGETNTIAGAISGTGNLIFAGAGTTVLSGASTYTGSATVSSGTLNVSGSIAASTGMTVDTGAFLNVTGTGVIPVLDNFGTTTFNTTAAIANNITNEANASLIFQGTPTLNNTITNYGLLDISGISGAMMTLPNYSDTSAAQINLGTKTLGLAGPGDTVTVNSVLSGTGGVVVLAGSSSPFNSLVNLYGVNTYTGLTEVQNDAKLFLGDGVHSAAVNGTILVDAGGILVVQPFATVKQINNNGNAVIGLAGGPTITNATGLTVNNTRLLGISYANINNTLINTTGGSSAVLVGDVFSINNSTLNTNVTAAAVMFLDAMTMTNSLIANSGPVTMDIVSVSGQSSLSGSTVTNGSGSSLVLDNVIINNTSISNAAGASLKFEDATIASGTNILNNGTFDISTMTLSTLTLQNLTGNGSIALGNTDLVLAPNQTSIWSGNISGNGSLTVAGTGTQVIDGINSYLGGTIVAASGRLEVGDASHQGGVAAIIGNTTVNAGGTLSGYGTIGTAVKRKRMVPSTLTNNGILMPGGGPDTPAGELTILGNYVQGSSGEYLIYIDSAGNTNSTDISGNASLAGILDVETLGNPLALNQVYTILEAGSVTGVFNVASKGLFYTQTVTYLPTEVLYSLSYNTDNIFAAAQTPNEQAVASNIVETNGTSSINTALVSIPSIDDLTIFLNQLTAATYANQIVSISQIDREFENQLAHRIDAYQMCVTENVRYYTNKEKYSFECNDQLIWVNTYGGKQTIKSQSGISGLNTNTYGLMMGGETPFANKTAVLGGGAGVVDYRSSTNGSDENASVSGDLYQFGIYFRQQLAINWRLGAALGFSIANSNDSDRNIDNVVNASKIISNYDTNLFSAQGRASYRYYDPYYTLQPIVGVLYQRVNQTSFTEVGDPGFALNVTTSRYSSLRSQIGAEFDFTLKYGQIEPFIYIGWEHEFKNQNGTFSASFIDGSGEFNIAGCNLGSNTLVLQTGLVRMERTNWELSLSFEGRYSSGYSQNLAVIQLGYF